MCIFLFGLFLKSLLRVIFVLYAIFYYQKLTLSILFKKIFEYYIIKLHNLKVAK